MPLYFSTGSQSLDKLIRHFISGRIYLVYGQTGTGKTTFACYSPIVSMLKSFAQEGAIPENARFFVFHCGRGFIRERLYQIADLHGVKRELVHTHVSEFYVRDFDTLFRYITTGLPSLISSKGYTPFLISIDEYQEMWKYGWDRIVTKHLPKWWGKRSAMFSSLLNELAHLVRKHLCIATFSGREKVPMMEKGFVTWRNEVYAPKHMTYTPDVVVKFSPTNKGDDIIRATLVKHRVGEIGKSCLFRLAETGIRDTWETLKKK